MRYLLFVALIAFISFSCSEKSKEHEEGTAEDDIEWKEMDEFHTIMADVYHPLKDSNDLAPIKKESGNFSAAATTWAQAKLPSKVDNEETKQLLAQLEDGAQALDKMVKEGSADEEIAAKLTSLHDTFHSIMEKWHKAGKEDGAEEHHDH
jgi:hypothetical protein